MLDWREVTNDTKLRVAFYGRVSTEHEMQVSALKNQIQWYEELAERNPNWEIIGSVTSYLDRGITGTQAKKRQGSACPQKEHRQRCRPHCGGRVDTEAPVQLRQPFPQVQVADKSKARSGRIRLCLQQQGGQRDNGISKEQRTSAGERLRYAEYPGMAAGADGTEGV